MYRFFVKLTFLIPAIVISQGKLMRECVPLQRLARKSLGEVSA